MEGYELARFLEGGGRLRAAFEELCDGDTPTWLTKRGLGAHVQALRDAGVQTLEALAATPAAELQARGVALSRSELRKFYLGVEARPAPSPSPFFVPEIPHILIELRQAPTYFVPGSPHAVAHSRRPCTRRGPSSQTARRAAGWRASACLRTPRRYWRRAP